MAVELTDGKKKAETAATMTKLNMKAPNRLFFLLYLSSMWTIDCYLVDCQLFPERVSAGNQSGRKLR